jgi:hypothetical protein
MARASVSIFPKKIDYSDDRSKPEVPDEVFEAALGLIEKKSGCELIRCKTGVYIVEYRETGPTTKKEGWEDWLPVYVAQLIQYSSGGIRTQEMTDYLTQKELTGKGEPNDS